MSRTLSENPAVFAQVIFYELDWPSVQVRSLSTGYPTDGPLEVQCMIHYGQKVRRTERRSSKASV